MKKRQFPCQKCGAGLEFDPGATSLKCPYCDHEHRLPQSEEDVEELDFAAYLVTALEGEETEERRVVKCPACAAESTPDPDVVSDLCPFCGTAIVTAASASKAIKPRSVLPFGVPRRTASQAFGSWLGSLWFAPGELQARARTESALNGVYVPYWTYDCHATSFYRGQRGDHYWVTRSYRTTVGGKRVTRTRRVRKTRWTSVSGAVWNAFDDVLVLGSRSLPRRITEKLEPWDLENLVPYADDYLSGFRAQSYQVDLAEGFELARSIMDGTIRRTVRRDIGGDAQRIDSLRTRHDDVTFKHVLLPIWISAYRYREKIYRFVVNGRTGEVQGERPWSWVKIVLTILAVLAAFGGVAGIVALTQ